MARFYTNENIAVQVVEELKRLGHDVLTSLEAGNANRSVPDRDVLAFATAEARILVSHNRKHFLQLHRDRQIAHSGMVLCTVDADFAALARRIHSAVASAPTLDDQIVRVNREC